MVIDGKKIAIGEKSTGEVLFTGSVKEQRPGRKGEPVRPRFLGGAELVEPPLPKGFKEPKRGKGPPPKPAFSRKAKLAEWLAAADNPYFARAAANRVWAQYMGRGLVHPVDDLGSKKPSHPALLDALTRELVAHKFDLKHLIREVVNSETYQLADTGPVKAALPESFERARVRPLSAEELMAALRHGDGTGCVRARSRSRTTASISSATSASRANGQGEFQGSLAEHLFLNNASQLRTLAQPRKGNLADTLLKSKAPWAGKGGSVVPVGAEPAAARGGAAALRAASDVGREDGAGARGRGDLGAVELLRSFDSIGEFSRLRVSGRQCNPANPQAGRPENSP